MRASVFAVLHMMLIIIMPFMDHNSLKKQTFTSFYYVCTILTVWASCKLNTLFLHRIYKQVIMSNIFINVTLDNISECSLLQYQTMMLCVITVGFVVTHKQYVCWSILSSVFFKG